VLVAVLCLIRPGVQSMRERMVQTISAALGRRVDIARVSLQFLPQPGFELKQFVVHDDPRFSAEPVLQAPEVTAVLRVGALFRGRLEIARLSFSEPSLNLARNKDGKWNAASLLERTSQTGTAAAGSARRTFPYIEADNARINLKMDLEKKPFALVNADFSLWQDSDLTWGMRLKAQPVRADFNLSDTGTIKVAGSWRPARQLSEIPLQFQFTWTDAQLGQGSKLLLSQDKGWRGELRLNADLTGTPQDLAIETQASVQDFRRYDIATGDSLRLAARCSAHYSTRNHSFSALACNAPVGKGSVSLNGSFSIAGSLDYDLTLSAQRVPLQALANLAQRAKRNLPADLTASGILEADMRFSRPSGGDAIWTGGGQAVNVQLESRLTQNRLNVDAVPFTLVSEPPASGKSFLHQAANSSRIEVGPLNLELPKVGLTSARGVIDRSGYSFDVQGQTDIPHLLRAAKTAGLNTPPLAAEGLAGADLNISGKWSGFAAPSVTGKVQLRGVRALVRGLKKPLELSSATVLLEREEVRAQNLTALLGGTSWRGSVEITRHCVVAHGCPVRFDLRADQIRTDVVWKAFETPSDGPWYSLLYPEKTPPSFLASLMAEGRIASSRIVFPNIAATKVSGQVKLEAGKLTVTHLTADVLGGQHSGEWMADFAARPPVYIASGTLDRAMLAQLSSAMNDDWVEGAVTGSYRVTASGWKRDELARSASGFVQWEARHGLLTHVALSEDEPLHFDLFSGRLLLRDGSFQIEESKLQSSDGIYQVTGTASLGRMLNLKLIRDAAHGFSVTGPLNDPHVAVAKMPETRAALKP